MIVFEIKLSIPKMKKIFLKSLYHWDNIKFFCNKYLFNILVGLENIQGGPKDSLQVCT